MADERFQDDLTEWLKAGAIKEGDAVRERLIQSMEQALANSGRASPEQIEFLKTGYFEALERTVFSNQVLAHWRHQLSLDYLRDQVTDLRRQAEEAPAFTHRRNEKPRSNDIARRRWSLGTSST